LKYISFLILTAVFLTSCGSKPAPNPAEGETVGAFAEDHAPEPYEAPSVEPEQITEQDQTTEPEQPTEQENILLAENSLTGLMIDEKTANRRPIAVVINNLHKALPQSGIAQSDIIYEVLAEGDITRLVAVFRDFSSAKIGPVRSARDYFLNFAFDNGAVFIHHGGSPGAYSLISRSGVDDIDGMFASDVFWRDGARSSVPGMYEHSSYTDAEKLTAGVESRAYDEPPSIAPAFNFADPPNAAGLASSVTVTYSKGYVRRFEYDGENGLYRVFQGDDPHIDEETGEQLAVANVIVQFADMYVIQGDAAGRREVRLTGEGKGFLFTNGGTAPLTWSKERLGAPTEWFGENGEKLIVSRGKTWINVYDGDIVVETSKKAKAGEAD
jgi:hypothetical protein